MPHPEGTNGVAEATERPDGSDTDIIAVSGLTHTYGQGPGAHTAIREIGFGVRGREFVSIVGPSGCGKTTLLRCISGLQEPTQGEVSVFGEPVGVSNRALGVVFQDYGLSLFPWMSVRKNIIFPLRGKGYSRSEMNERADEALEDVGLAGFGDRYPWQLSGGMQQRVAIGRALAYRPRIFIMDEPFASVDAYTRAELEDLLLRVTREHEIPTLFVTHDIDESVYLSDRVLVLSRGPARVVADVAIDLPVVRDQIETRRLEAFTEARARVAELVIHGSEHQLPEGTGDTP
jgi:NitT/TauT family transport system ATP-binding protein